MIKRIHVNFVYVVYIKRYRIILIDLCILYTQNMNFVSRCDYFDVSHNRQTEKQTNTKIKSDHEYRSSKNQNNPRTHTYIHTHIGIINLALLFSVILYILRRARD